MFKFRMAIMGFLLFLSPFSYGNMQWQGPFQVKYVKYIYTSGGEVVEIKANGASGDVTYIYRTFLNHCSEDRGKTIMNLALTARNTGENVFFNDSLVDNGQHLFFDISMGDGYQ
jgi:hypothetical protein